MKEPAADQTPASTALIIEPSSPIRKLLAKHLQKNGIASVEAVNVTDAIYSLRDQLPESFVFSSVMGKSCGRSLAKGLAAMGKTSDIPVILLLNNEEGEKNGADLPENVTSISKDDSVNHLAPTLTSALGPYLERKVSAGSDEKSGGIALPKGKQFTRLEDAFGQFNKVMKMIKENRLPGPIMPGMLIKVRQLLSNSEVTMAELSNFSLQHQSLSAKVMSMANNVFYAPRGIKAQSLDIALGRLGLSKISQIFHAVAALGYMTGKNLELRNMIKTNLGKGYLVAMISELLGGHHQCKDKDKTYTIGLFHNIGATFMYYTLALLHDKGDIAEVDGPSLATMTSTRGEELNSTVSTILELPREISLLYSAHAGDLPDEEVQKMVSSVNQAIWLTDQIYDQPTLPFRLNDEARMLGIDETVIKLFNGKKADLLTLLREYLRH